MDTLVIAQIVVAGAQDMVFALAMGALVCDIMLRWRASGVWISVTRTRLVALCALALLCLVYLWLQSAVMSGSSLIEAAPAVAAVLSESHFGIAWSTGFAGVLLALVGGTGRHDGAWFLSMLGMVVYAAGKAAASHAADGGDFTLRETLHVVHLCATAIWAGGVIVSAWVVTGETSALSGTSRQRTAYCTRLSSVATFALAVVVVTGLYDALQDTAQMSMPLLSGLYGRVLAIKVLFVMVAVFLGGYNRMTQLPRLDAARQHGGPVFALEQRRFHRVLVAEAVVMVMVLAMAGWLGHTSPTGM